MTGIHGKSSSTSYGRRYLMCMIWNIPTQDNDGNGAVSTKASDKQLSAIRDMLIANGDEKNEAAFAKFLGIEKLEDLPASDFKKAMAALEARKEIKGAKK